MITLIFFAIVVVGFVACAEFGSYAFVHPVIRRLPMEQQLRAEQGLLRTFGRVMPIGMTASPVLALSVAIGSGGLLAWVSTGLLFLALATTIAVNVGINRHTGTWDPDHPPADWQQTRRRWDLFQAVRSWLLLLGFVVLVAAVVLT